MIASTLRKAGATLGRVIDQDDRELIGRGVVLAALAFLGVVFVAFSVGVAIRAFEIASKL